ncbi:MAG TPA: PHB depolymerase family esterase [Anaerolineales bacterium]|nr:PHB depolymerase family esterase [Anaerolineales bacterium]
MNFISMLSAVILLFGIAACGTTAAPPTPTLGPTLQPSEAERTLTVGGLKRSYLLHIPPGIDTSRPVPVVFALHGFDNEIHYEIIDMQNVTGLSAMSDSNGFVLVYASSYSGFWNVGGGCCAEAATDNVDEPAYFRAVLADLNTVVKVDPKRVYAMGFSMGGMLSFALACQMADTFAAIAPIAGSELYTPCQPSQPVSIMQVHGKQDLAMPYAGGKGGFLSGTYTFLPVEQTLADWARLDGCSATPTTDQVGVAVHTVYPKCKNGTSVELYTIDALGSNWPTQYVLPVTQMMWDFFKAHPKK